MSSRDLQLNMVLKAKDGLSGIVHSAVTKSDKEFKTLRESLAKTSDTLNDIGKKSMVAGGALIAASAVNLKMAADFETGMSSVSTLIDTNTEDFGAMKKQVLDIAKRTPVALNDLTSSLYDIRSAGIAAENQFKVLEKSAQLGVAGLGSTSEAVDLVTSSLNAFQLKGTKADKVYDNIFKTVKYGKTTISGIAQGFGAVAGTVAAADIELDDYLASVSALTTTGQPAAQAHTQIKAAISGMTRESKEAKEVFNALGAKNFKDLVQKSGSMVSAFAKITSKVKGNDAAILKLFGSTEAYNAVVGLTTKQHKAYIEALNAMRNAPSLVDEAYIKKLNTVNAGLQRGANFVQKIGIDFGTALMPSFNKFLNVAEKGLNIIDKLPDGVKNFMALATAGAGIGLVAFGGLAMGAGAAVSGFEKALVAYRNLNIWLWANPLKMPKFELGTFAGNIALMKTGFKNACIETSTRLTALRFGLINTTGSMIAFAKASYLAAPNKFAWALGGIGNAILSPIKGFWGLTKATWAFNAALLSNPITWVVAGIAGAALLVYKYWKPISGFFKGLWSGVVEATAPLHPLFNKIGEAVRPIVNWFKALIKPVEDVDGKAFNLGKTIGSAIGGAINWFAGLAKAVWNVLKWTQPLYLAFRGIKALASKKNGSKISLGITPLSDTVLPDNSLPKFAKGGFTSGLSLAGEKGTEAVISFDTSERNRNIGIWQQAGNMLGISSNNGNDEGAIILHYAPVIQILGDVKEAPAWLLKLLDEHTKKIIKLLETRSKRREAGAYA